VTGISFEVTKGKIFGAFSGFVLDEPPPHPAANATKNTLNLAAERPRQPNSGEGNLRPEIRLQWVGIVACFFLKVLKL
jgi:hypothetical protein